MNDHQYIQYGCGWTAPLEWRNFDASPTLRMERLPLIGLLFSKNKSRFPGNVEYGDIIRGLPLATGSWRGVYCSHMLDYLSLDDFRAALRNTHKILQKDGVFRFVLEDFEFFVKRYANDDSADASLKFMGETLGHEKRDRSLKGLFISWLGNSQRLWMWDYKSIEVELKSAGFKNIRRASFGDSTDPRFREVEEIVRWKNCLGVECRKSD